MFLKIARRHFSSKINPKINYYEVLDLKNEKASSDNEIKQKFYALAKKYHPDNTDTQDAEKFKKIAEAYEILGDKTKKDQYDELRRIKEVSVTIN